MAAASDEVFVPLANPLPAEVVRLGPNLCGGDNGMANEISRVAPLRVEPSRVWTLVITGGNSFIIEIPLTPTLHHDGGRTVWKMHGSEGAAVAVEELIKERAGVRVERLTEIQSESQTHERMELLGLNEDDPDT